ncbi:hypothetical protein HDU91_004435, partial [Kappamyces sp. JEL0680]
LGNVSDSCPLLDPTAIVLIYCYTTWAPNLFLDLKHLKSRVGQEVLFLTINIRNPDDPERDTKLASLLSDYEHEMAQFYNAIDTPQDDFLHLLVDSGFHALPMCLLVVEGQCQYVGDVTSDSCVDALGFSILNRRESLRS